MWCDTILLSSKTSETKEHIVYAYKNGKTVLLKKKRGKNSKPKFSIVLPLRGNRAGNTEVNSGVSDIVVLGLDGRFMGVYYAL